MCPSNQRIYSDLHYKKLQIDEAQWHYARVPQPKTLKNKEMSTLNVFLLVCTDVTGFTAGFWNI